MFGKLRTVRHLIATAHRIWFAKPEVPKGSRQQSNQNRPALPGRGPFAQSKGMFFVREGDHFETNALSYRHGEPSLCYPSRRCNLLTKFGRRSEIGGPSCDSCARCQK